jgi:hypothetical protein
MLLLSRTRCRINQIFFYIPVWWDILCLESIPTPFKTSQFVIFMAHFKTVQQYRASTSHSLHFSCTRVCIPCLEHVWKLWRSELAYDCWSYLEPSNFLQNCSWSAIEMMGMRVTLSIFSQVLHKGKWDVSMCCFGTACCQEVETVYNSRV